MTWVVDTCVLLDILDEIPPFAEAAAEALDVKSHIDIAKCLFGR